MRKHYGVGKACVLLAAALSFSVIGVPAVMAVPSASQRAQALIETAIPHTQLKGEGHRDGNFFRFSPKGWTALGGAGTEEHVWSDSPSASLKAEDVWYEVTFVGNSIDIYSGKNHPMGTVTYTVDPGTEHEQTQTHSLYNKTNIPCTKITSFENLGEGAHVLRAQATGKRAEGTGAGNTCIDCSKVVVRHEPYMPTKLEAAAGSVSFTLREGGKAQIALSTAPDYISNADLDFVSRDPKIASVDENGAITAEGRGKTVITVSPKAAGELAVRPLEIAVTVAESPVIDGFISDVDTQWTQDRYGEALDRIGKGGLTGKLTAWKNDAAISEIVLATAKQGVEGVALTASDFRTEAGDVIAAENVDLSFIGSTKAYNGAFLGWGNQPGRDYADNGRNRQEVSDVLLGDAPVSVDAKSLQNVFVKVNVPKDAKAGTYTSKISVSAAGMAEPLEFTYTLKVQDAQLPDPSEFENSFDIELWQYPYTSAEYYGVEPFSAEHFEILKPIMALYKQLGGHAITTTVTEEAWQGQTYADDDSAGHNEKIHYPSMVRWEMDENGTMHYDFTNFDKWVEFNKELGIGDKIILYSIAPWIQNNGEPFKNQAIKYWQNGELKGVDSSTVGTATGNKFWRHFLNAMVEHLEEKGWFDDAYVGIDERGFSHEAFDLVDSVKNSKGESLKTAGAMDNIGNTALAMRVDDLNVGDYIPFTKADTFDKLLEMRNNAGLRTTLYSCTGHAPGNFSLSSPVESYWSMINAGKQGTSGFLRWAYDAWTDDPLNDTTHWSFEPGDCFLVYPGADKETIEANKGNLTAEMKTAKSSLRLERMAEGVRDVNKIMLMERDATELSDEIDALYDEVTVPGRHTEQYLPAAEVKQLDAEADAFKAGLDELSDTFIETRDAAGAVAKPSRIAITGADTVAVDQSIQLNAQLEPAAALARGVVWSASNTDVATVSTEGVVTGVKTGVCTITAASEVDDSVVASFKVTVTGAVVEVPQVDVEAAKVAHYGFEQDASDDWIAAGAHDGTVKAATFEKARMGKGVRVNAAEGKTVSLPDEAMNLDGGKSWTVAYWVKSLGALDKQSLPLFDQDSQYAFALRLGDADGRNYGGLRNGPNDGDVLSFGPKGYFKPNTWYRIAWTQDASKGMTMYVNGKQVGDLNTWTKNNKDRIKVPVDLIGGNGFDGIVDELAIYNRALTKDEIAAQLAAFTPEEEPGEQQLLDAAKKTVYQGDAFGITGAFDKTATFEVVETKNVANDTGAVVKVSEDGLVTALQRGYAKIRVTCNGASQVLDVTVKKNVTASNMLSPVLVDQSKDAGYISDLYDPRTAGDGNWEQGKKYYGQPDMVRTRTGRLITAFPQGHGHGPLLMRYSDDNGTTWQEFEKPLPEGWKGSQETPTLYTLKMADGRERIMLITACPGRWSEPGVDNRTGWDTSYSDDNGETWTEYTNWYPELNGRRNESIVGMASLIQLRDPKTGEPIQKWMGVYHDFDYVNYKTYLTFDEDGREQWTEPVPYLSEHREIEKTYQMCEIGMFRSPDGRTIVGLARSQSHNKPSTLIMSTDEGETWSEPIDLPGSLAGERHKALYDPVSGKLLITFREIQFDLDYDNKFEGGNDWICNSWGMWVGSYEDLIAQRDGDYRFRLSEDWTRNRYKGDCGYTGMTVDENGLFVMDSYGHWDRKASDSMNPYNVKQDLCYIRQARFTLKDLLEHHGLEQEALPVTAKVTFNYQDGVTPNKVVEVAAGATVTEPAVPVRDGYTFDGWFIDEACTQRYDFGSAIESNLVLFAKWVADKPVDPEPPVNPDGPDQGDDKVTVEKHPDGSQTVTTKGDDGSKTVVEIDKSGKVTSVDATVSQDAAKDGSATLPMEGLEQTSSKNAPTIKVDVPASVSKDDPLAITVPVAKAKGEKTVDPGLVVVKVDKDGKQTVLPKTAFGADGVTVEVDGDCEIKVVDAAKTFPDVKDSDWFAAEVVPFATARGILNGVAAPDGSREFKGDGETSRAMFVAMLSNLELGPKAQSGSSFADVPGDAWYANAAAWAAENDLVEGKGGTSFDGEGEVTREQIAVFLMRYADFLGLDTSARTDVDFPDADEVSEWAREAMSWAVAEGLFTGNGVTGELDPASGATRAETATVLMRFINQMYA